MCEANAFLRSGRGEEEIMTEVDRMDVEGDHVVLRDLLGNSKKVKGVVRTVDFAAHRVLIETAA